jgi:hypothetical protein
VILNYPKSGAAVLSEQELLKIKNWFVIIIFLGR